MKLEKRIVKGDVLKMVEEEEQWLQKMAKEETDRINKVKDGYESHFA